MPRDVRKPVLFQHRPSRAQDVEDDFPGPLLDLLVEFDPLLAAAFDEIGPAERRAVEAWARKLDDDAVAPW